MRIKGLHVARQATLARADELINDDGSLGTMFVRFSPVETWYRISSFWEGEFMERTLPGAFKKTARDARRSDGLYSTKVQFNHGMDFNIGDKLLGVPTRFEEIDTPEYRGPELEVPLEDTSYNRDLVPILRRGGYGSSFMFEVVREEWNNEPEESEYNPDRLPERSIREVRVMEAGPVTWPASPTASSGMRSLTDAYVDQVASRNGRRRDDLIRSLEAFRAAYKTPDARFIPTPDSDDSELRRQIEEDMAERDLAVRRAARLALASRR